MFWVQKHNIWHSEDSVSFSISLDKDNAMGSADIGFAVKAFESPADRPRQRKVYTDLKADAFDVYSCSSAMSHEEVRSMRRCGSVQ